VVAVGSGRVLGNGRVVPLAVKAGDRVIYGKYGGNDFKLGGQEYKIVQESEILAVIE
jgi:chaperonin GroES